MRVADTAVTGLQQMQGIANVKETVLLISRDRTLTPLQMVLQQNGIETVVCNDAVKALAQVRCQVPSLILINRSSMRSLDLRYFTELRSIPIVMFYEPGAQCEEDDCINGLDDGAAAVICNGTYREVVARLRAILRRERCQHPYQKSYNTGCLVMDLERHEVTVNKAVVELTNKEFTLLQVLLESPGRVLSRQELLDRVWSPDCALDEHALDVHIHHLRRKIESNAYPHPIMTVRGIGYKFCENR